MTTEQRETINFKLENHLSSGDYTKKEIKKEINKCTKISMESHVANEGEDKINIETNLEIADNESVYEESFYSDHSDDEQELATITRYSSMMEMPLFKFTRIQSNVTKENILNFNKLASASNISDKSDLLEDKVKYLSLHEVQTKNMRSQSIRKNMSFTNEQIMKIEHDNELLLKKIMSQQSPQKIKKLPVQTKLCSNAIKRKKFQKKIEEDNIVLLRRLQHAKSCVVISTKIPGYRRIYL